MANRLKSRCYLEYFFGAVRHFLKYTTPTALSLLAWVAIILVARTGFASPKTVELDFEKNCISQNGSRICTGPGGYEALIFTTPMGQQLTLKNDGVSFSVAVIRCEQGQRIAKLFWRLKNTEPFAAMVAFRCGVAGSEKNKVPAKERWLVQGLKHFERYGHEIPVHLKQEPLAAAQSLADSWL